MKPFKTFILECIDFLIEDRIQFLKDKNPSIDTSHDTNALHSEAPDIIDHFATNADPSRKKVHTQWILGQYKKKLVRQEDHPRINAALSNFDRYKTKLEKKDINQYGSLSEIEDAVAPHLGTAATKKEMGTVSDKPGHRLVHTHTDAEGNQYDVYHLSDKKVSQDVYGGGHSLGYPHTSWCTAARSENCMFGDYAKEWNLYIIHKTDRTGKKEAFQLHPKTRQFMDAKDEPVDAKEFPREVFGFKDEHMPKFRLFSGFASKDDFDKLVNDESFGVRYEVAKRGHKEHLDKLVNDDDNYVRAEVAKRGHKEHLDKLVNDDDNYVRAEVAKHGHKEHLDKLVNDADGDVREAVAKRGHKEHLDTLVNDDYWGVRAGVASRGHKEHLDKLVNDDESASVRAEVAKHGHKEHLDKLVNDDYWGVRYEVATYGHKEHLDKLVNDNDNHIRSIAKSRLDSIVSDNQQVNP